MKIILLIILTLNFYLVRSQEVKLEALNETSMIELIANPDKFHEKLIRISGVFKKDLESGIIFFTRDDLKYNITKNSFLVRFDNEILKEIDLIALDKQYVTIIGYFNKNLQGMGRFFSGSLYDIKAIINLEFQYIERQYINIMDENDSKKN